MIVNRIPVSIEKLSLSQLRARHRKLLGRDAPPGYGADKIAEVVARATALRAADARAKERAPGMHHARDDKRLPPPGSIIEREFDGAVHRVTVLDDAFEYAGRRYTSLSTIAKEITGTIWNGFAFFGVTNAKQASRPGLAKSRPRVESRRAANG